MHNAIAHRPRLVGAEWSDRGSSDSQRGRRLTRELVTDLAEDLRGAPTRDGLLVLLVTDLREFTVLVERLGDRDARMLIRDHNCLLRKHIAQCVGAEVAHTGDGIIAAFRSVSAALRCALEIQRDLGARYGDPALLCARIGVHAGEPLYEDGRLFGSCVNLAVRVCGVAEAPQILVTDVVRQLAYGTGFDFVTSRVLKLKGFDRTIRVHELGSGP